jgi:hypothetical protein
VDPHRPQEERRYVGDPLDTTDEVETAEPALKVESGDPLLKRLVDLSRIGWEADLILYSNGSAITGHLISGAKFRAALAESIRTRVAAGEAGSDLDSIVAAAVAAEEPPPSPELEPDFPEPRFIHLADVRLLDGDKPIAPFLRLRLPAVSGFWIRSAPRK